MSLFLILSTEWTYSQPIWMTKVKNNSKILAFFGFPILGPIWALFSLCGLPYSAVWAALWA